MTTNKGSNDISDEKLAHQIGQGNLNAFTSLYERYLPTVYNRVRYVVPEQDIEDVTQEVFIAVLESVGTFRGELHFSTWLRTLTNRKVAEYYRRRNRRHETRQVPISDVETMLQTGQKTRQIMEERITLRRAIALLPEHYREVILLRFAEGLRFNQIAEVLDQNPDATKSLFRRAISALRNNLDQ